MEHFNHTVMKPNFERLNTDLLLEIFRWCNPKDVLELSLVSKRFYSLISAYRRHLPRFSTNCSVKLTGEHDIKIKLWPSTDNIGIGASSKQIIYMPRMNANQTELMNNLSRYKITNLSLYGSDNSKVDISGKFIKLLTVELQPIIEFCSLRNLNMCDLDNGVWSKFLDLCNSTCKFSSINCTFPRLSMIYDLYDHIHQFDYITETYTTIHANDLSIDHTDSRNQKLLQQLINGNSSAVDLSSIQGLTTDLILSFISSWIHSKSPNDFSYLCLWKKFDGSQLERQLIGHENGQLVSVGLVEFKNSFNRDLRLYVDNQRLFLNFCVKNHCN